MIDIVRALIHANRRMFEEHIAFILKEIIKALTYLHGHLLAHGDIKGNNILLTTRGEVKLIDFNLSRCSVRDRGSIEKLRQGSPCWMAPEVNKNAWSCIRFQNVVDTFLLCGSNLIFTINSCFHATIFFIINLF